MLWKIFAHIYYLFLSFRGTDDLLFYQFSDSLSFKSINIFYLFFQIIIIIKLLKRLGQFSIFIRRLVDFLNEYHRLLQSRFHNESKNRANRVLRNQKNNYKN